ncbi:hypothetical protein [Streptomyces anulatus]|uniref:hypothetical protein n=1 Tax=Streptomyces anulatus TaxID=1892 RepID=UPI003245704A
MNAKRINAAVGVVLAAQKQRQTAAGIAAALEAAGLLQSPESAAEVVVLRERVAELEAEAYGDAVIRLVDPVSQIRHLHACVAAQRSRADVLDHLCGTYQERAELLEGSPWERAVAGLNALVDAGVAFHVELDGHISAPFSDEHIEWDLKAKRWVLTHDDGYGVHPNHPAPCRVPESPDCTCRYAPEDPHDSPLHQSYELGRDLPYFENPGVPTPEERGTYCPHGVLIAGLVSPNVFWVIDPWPCAQPGCTREKFERVQAEVAAELAEAETGGAL